MEPTQERVEYPELNDAELEKIIAAWSPEQLEQAAFSVRAQYARDNFGPKGFADFYWCIWKRELPKHAQHWVEKLFEAYDNRKGLMLKSSRGLTKSTTLITFSIYAMGNRPIGSGVVIQASDVAANKSSALMAATIEFNAGFKRVFPHVLPDKTRGWGAQGYYLRDARYPKADESHQDRKGSYDDWVALTTQDHLRDPSFVAAGIGSSDAVGMHPSNFLLLDDIHDEKNTVSLAEKNIVKNQLKANVLPTTIRAGQKPIICVAYTPWDIDDAYAMMEKWTGFVHISTPGYVEAAKDTEGAVYWPARQMWIVLTFPEALGIDELDFYWQLGEKDFYRMILCDLQKSAGINLKMEWLHRYPHERIDKNWSVYIGVDYASTSDDPTNRNRSNDERDYFALCWLRLTPAGGLVLEDGIMDHISQGEAEQKVYATSLMFDTLAMITVEAIGKGEEFYNKLYGRAGMPLMPVRSHVGEARSKGGRFERVLAPMFQFSRIMVSDLNTPFINRFIEQWANWGSTRSINDDALDAVFMGMYGARHFLALPRMDEKDPFRRKEAKESPWMALSNH